MKKKLYSILLSLAMVVTMMPMMTCVAFADATPIPGSNTTWELSNDGKTLTIGGTGAMPDFGLQNKPPWQSNKSTITTVIIESGVTRIGNFAFTSYRKLTSVTIPSSVTSIGDSAFTSCINLTSVTIPSSVTSIGDYAFSSCNNLISVTIKSVNPPTLCDSVFNARNTNLILYVPSKSVDTYKNAEGWRMYKEIIQAMPLVTFNMNGHGTQVPEQDVAKGENVIAPATPTADGWEFAGWYTDEECTAGREYDFSTSVTEDMTLHAKWVEKSKPTPAPTPDPKSDDTNKGVKTGDSSDIFFYGFTTLLALLGAGFVYGLRRKEEK